MDNQSASVEPTDSRVQAALKEYLERVDRGERLNREQFLSERPEIAPVLRSFIDAEEQLRKLAGAPFPGERGSTSTQSFALHGQETIAPRAGLQQPDPGKASGLNEQFGRYRIVKALGKGAMGMVYLAEDTQLERQVALKTPHFEQEPTPELLERFYREARAAATLRHPNICPVYDVGQIDGKHYISMAFIDGHPLSAFIRSAKPQPERQILIVVRKLAQALQEAHEHGVVHRDLKPANIMIDKRNEPIIMDFGLARQLQCENQVRITQSGMLIGTPAYMSPEQIDGEPDKVSPASDQYSLGVILYELLTGQLPFRGSLAAVMAQIITKETTPPSQLRTGLDLRIEAVCLKMMAKAPASRFASLSAVAEELATILRSPEAKQPSLAPNEQTAPAAPPADSNAGSSPRQSVAKKSLAQGGQTASLAAKDLVALEELARKCLARHDYEQVIQILERIPEGKRGPNLRTMLEQARGKTDEIAFLICEIDEAVRFNDGKTAVKKADELLKIKPGHHRALKVQEQFAGHGPGGAARLGPLRQFTRSWSDGGYIPWAALIFGIAVFGVMTAIIVISLGKTAVVIDVKDPGIDVAVKGTKISITGPDKQKFEIEPGEQHLAIRYQGVDFGTEKSFDIKKREKRLVTVALVNGQILATLDQNPAPLLLAPDKTKAMAGAAESGKPSIAPPQSSSGGAKTLAAISPRTTANAAVAVGTPRLLAAPFDLNQSAAARQAWASAQKIEEEIKNSVGMDLVLIPAGQFQMGSPETADDLLKAFPNQAKRDWMDGERPVHRVTIDRPFYLAKYEVTVAQFRKFVDETGYKTEPEKDWKGGMGRTPNNEIKQQQNFNWRDWGAVQTDNCPVVNVTHKDATEFCKWISNKEGRQYRLPSEAEWEYACRAGSTTRFYNGDDPGGLAKIANFGRHAAKDGRYTFPVGRFAPNNFGLYDMSGNVSEWCADWWGVDYYARSPVNDPEGPEHGSDHVSRGGGWYNPPIFARSAHRRHFGPGRANCNIGFRVACATASGLSTASSAPALPPAAPAAESPKEDEHGYLIAPFNESAAKRAAQEWADKLTTPIELTNSIGMHLRLVPPGQFRMGGDRNNNEGPEHDVRISRPLYFGIYEVTKGDFARFIAATQFKTNAERVKGAWRLDNTARTRKWESSRRQTWRHPGFSQENNHPVVVVSWNDAEAFCKWLSQKEQKSYRLPTEAEWEYASRAGTTGKTYNADEAESRTIIGNIADASASKKFPAWNATKFSDGFIYTSPAGHFRPNNFGLYDTIGNAAEWCSDWYAEDYYQNSPAIDPSGPSGGTHRVARGGSFTSMPYLASRSYYTLDHRASDCGFRLVCDIPPGVAHAPQK